MKNTSDKKAWEETGDIQGHKPAFEMECKYCGINLDFRMSNLMKTKSPNVDWGVNELGYKCKRCGFYQRFFVEAKLDYLDKILKLRKGNFHYFPPFEEWEEDDEKARQLEALGYYGGR